MKTNVFNDSICLIIVDKYIEIIIATKYMSRGTMLGGAFYIFKFLIGSWQLFRVVDGKILYKNRILSRNLASF